MYYILCIIYFAYLQLLLHILTVYRQTFQITVLSAFPLDSPLSFLWYNNQPSGTEACFRRRCIQLAIYFCRQIPRISNELDYKPSTSCTGSYITVPSPPGNNQLRLLLEVSDRITLDTNESVDHCRSQLTLENKSRKNGTQDTLHGAITFAHKSNVDGLN